MANNFNYPNSVYVETTSVYDTNEIQNLTATQEMKDLLVRLYQNLNLMANALNQKETGYYDNSQEFVISSTFFPPPLDSSTTALPPAPRPIYRTTVNFGALPNAGAKSVAHNIAPTVGFTITKLNGYASDTTGLTYLPIPYANVAALANQIQLDMDVTNVTITTGSNRTNYNVCYVVIEYVKY